MTGYTVHTGSTAKFSTGWDRIFSSRKPARNTTGKATQKSPAKKGAARKKK